MGSRAFVSFLTASLILAASFSLAGCSHISYLFHAAKGQLALYNHERPFKEVLADPSVPASIKVQLRVVETLKKIVEQELGVKATSNYTTYVQLDRPVANWVLIAVPPFELKDKNWCFPLVGCFPYLGFFDLKLAKSWAEDLKKEGYDTHVRGASAYSTLGYLRDPLLSSMLSRGEGDLANLIFHETTHTQIYLSGEGSFNEEVASFIGEYGERLYLLKKYGEKSPQVRSWSEDRQQRRHFGATLRAFADELRHLYKEKSGDTQAKEAAFARFREIMKGEGIYSRWAPTFTNNAVVMSLLTYDDDQPLFDAVFEYCGKDLRRSLEFLRKFSKEYDPEKFKGQRIQDVLAVQIKI